MQISVGVNTANAANDNYASTLALRLCGSSVAYGFALRALRWIKTRL